MIQACSNVASQVPFLSGLGQSGGACPSARGFNTPSPDKFHNAGGGLPKAPNCCIKKQFCRINCRATNMFLVGAVYRVSYKALATRKT